MLPCSWGRKFYTQLNESGRAKNNKSLFFSYTFHASQQDLATKIH
jgi:hypothetical protein